MNTRVVFFLAVFLGTCVARSAANASVVFDWPNNGWTAGTPTAGQTLTQSFTSVNPNDITVSINNSGNGAQGVVFQNNYPQVSRNPDTGGFGSTNALQELVGSSQVVGAYVKTTVSFATPVTNLSFQIWDVDANPGQFIDEISNIQALAQGGGIVGADSVTSTTPGYNTVTGTGLLTVVLGIANANNGSNQGSIDIVFNGPITQFSFQWSNNDPALGAQGIALGSLTYTPVPEISPVWSPLTAGVAVLATELARRRARRRS